MSLADEFRSVLQLRGPSAEQQSGKETDAVDDRNLKERADMPERRSLRWRAYRAADAGGAENDSLPLKNDDPDASFLYCHHKNCYHLAAKLWVCPPSRPEATGKLKIKS